jgi:hypothetical protein
MRGSALRGMLLIEVAASTWFEKMTPAEQQAYIKSHPRTKFKPRGEPTRRRDVDEAWRLYADHPNGAVVGKKLNISQTQARRALMRHPEYQRVSDEINAIRRSGDFSLATHPIVQRYAHEHPDELRPTQRMQRDDARAKNATSRRVSGEIVPDQATIDQIVPMLRKGMTPTQAAKHLNVNRVSIHYHGRRLLGADPFRQLVAKNTAAQGFHRNGSAMKTIRRPGTMDNHKTKLQTNGFMKWRSK